jgi:pimeloyl-ACP methyl ester carboxylesterase
MTMSGEKPQKTSLAGFPALRVGGRGDRPPLFFIHGAFVTHEPFADWMELLAGIGWRGVAASRRGRLGVGPDRAEGVSVADYVEDTRRAVEAMGEAPILVGHSLGALIAQKIAEMGLCRGMVLLAPAPAAMLTAQPVAVTAYLRMLPKILAGRPLVPACGVCSTIALNCVPEDEHEAIHARLIHESGKAYREMIFGAIKVDAGKVRCPVLVVNGGKDRIISPALARQSAERFGAELKLYPANGHWLIEEKGWQNTAGDVGEWLEAKFAGRCPNGRGGLPAGQRI